MSDRNTYRPIIVWLVFGLVLAVLAGLFDSPFLAIPAVFCIVAVYAIATLLVVGRQIRVALELRTARAWLTAAAVPVLLCALVTASPFVMWLAGLTHTYVRFAVRLPVYSQVVSDVTQSRLHSGDGVYESVRYQVDRGPPVRIVFPHEGGIIDNWIGTVYDPTDEVAQVTGWNYANGGQEFTAPSTIRGLFGGDLVECSRLYGHYYLCNFT